VARKERVSKRQMSTICDGIVDGLSLNRILASDPSLPSYRTIMRHIQEDDEAHDQYRKARAIQVEMLRDEIIELVEKPLPDDPKMAQAEVARRRLEAEQKDKYVRQLQPLGLRNKAEDQNNAVSGTITLKWNDTESA
jgi:hypothetical protein